MGRMSQAMSSEARALDVEEKLLRRLMAVGSEAEKRAYLDTLTERTHGVIAFALEVRDERAAHQALTTLLRRKGRALDAMTDSMRTLRIRLGPEDRALFDVLQAARNQYVTRSLRGPGATPLEAYRRDQVALNEEIQRLESTISKRSKLFGVETRPITVDSVREALPTSSALVEWSVYAGFDPRGRTGQEQWGPFRYAASVLPDHGSSTWLDLGDASTIDADVKALRAALSRPATKDTAELARALEAKIMAPVRALLGNTRHVFISPDSTLNLIPFGALVGEDGRPLIERYAFTYLTSGRDLLRRAFSAPMREPPLVVTEPAFDFDQPTGGPFQPLLHAATLRSALMDRFQRPAPGVLAGREATKDRLQQVHGPQFLHVNSHGYFDSTVCTNHPSPELLHNPLLRSGIALAGANACAHGDNRGLLTASEVSALDLYGTRLVVLSACETGVGEVQAGDGVYGLRRALVLAGAETQVMSLWKVEEASTAVLMKAYYEGLSQGGGRSEAMRQAQLAMLHDGRHEHPYYWASFIVSGDDRSLDGKAVDPDLHVHARGACACRAGERGSAEDGAWMAALAVIVVVRSSRTAARRRILGTSGRSAGARPVSSTTP
jgi:CHAT domain-containing protein